MTLDDALNSAEQRAPQISKAYIKFLAVEIKRSERVSSINNEAEQMVVTCEKLKDERTECTPRAIWCA